MALESTMSINSVSMFQVPKFLGEFEWPSFTHMPILGPITKGMSLPLQGC